MDLKSLEHVLVDLGDGIAVVRISRTRALNAVNQAVLGELKTAFTELEAFDSLTCVILTGDGDKAFVAGADIEELSHFDSRKAAAFVELGHEITMLIERFPVPVLAAVNGYALGGGCELALACDMIYASDKAKFGQPEVKLGLIPGFGGTVRLPRKIGLAAASEWIYTGETYSAQQAQALGLVREVLSPEDLMPRVREIAALIAKRSPVAVRAAKRAISRGMAVISTDAAGIEREQFAELFATEDMREGTTAFLEKREPEFTGR